MIFKQYIDLKVSEDKYLNNIRIDIDLIEDDIVSISPMLNSYGAKLKHVSLLADRYGNQYKVKGNYLDLVDKVRNKKRNKIGF